MLENVLLARVNKLQPGAHYVIEKEDSQIAQYKCVDVDRGY